MKRGIQAFFRYARARHEIYLRRVAGEPRPWTKDQILQQYRFTNVFRELDKTTVWFRKHVRDPLRDKPEVLLATVVFRLLNRIPVGEGIFCQLNLHLGDPDTAFGDFVQSGDIRVLKRAVKAVLPTGPYVTGAYIISSPPGYPKLDGMLRVIDNFNKTSGWRGLGWEFTTLEGTWTWLKDFKYFGPFHSYEIVTDLRHTALLENAPDIMTWANPGPGCRRGLNRVFGRDKSDHTVSRDSMMQEMRWLLEVANRNSTCWPETNKLWPAWEMRDVEHTLCEFDKYERVRLGEGRPRGVYR